MVNQRKQYKRNINIMLDTWRVYIDLACERRRVCVWGGGGVLGGGGGGWVVCMWLSLLLCT